MHKGKFVVKTISTGFYRFNLHASNGRIIATSRNYPSEEACLFGIEVLRKTCPFAIVEDQTKASQPGLCSPKFEIYMDKAGEYRFRFRHTDEEILVFSEGYLAKSNCLRGIRSVCTHAPLAALLWEE